MPLSDRYARIDAQLRTAIGRELTKLGGATSRLRDTRWVPVDLERARPLRRMAIVAADAGNVQLRMSPLRIAFVRVASSASETPLGELVFSPELPPADLAALLVAELPDLIGPLRDAGLDPLPLLHAAAERRDAVNAIREVLEWGAVLAEVARPREEPVLIVRDGLFRSIHLGGSDFSRLAAALRAASARTGNQLAAVAKSVPGGADLVNALLLGGVLHQAPDAAVSFLVIPEALERDLLPASFVVGRRMGPLLLARVRTTGTFVPIEVADADPASLEAATASLFGPGAEWYPEPGSPVEVTVAHHRARVSALDREWMRRAFLDALAARSPRMAKLAVAAEVLGLRADDPSRVRLGVLSRGHETVRDVEVQFSIERLKGRRTFVFARAGYGKSNLVKLLLSRLYASPPDVGLLIVDPEGEYAFPSGNTPGLADHPDIRSRLRVYTQRDPAQFRAAVRASISGRVKPDMARLTPTAFLGAFVPEEKQQQVWANWLRMGRERGWASLVEVLRRKGYQARDEEIFGALEIRPPGKDKEKDGNVSVQAIRNNVIPVLERLDGQADLASEVCHHLVRNAGVVVLDVSCMPAHDADAIVRLLLQRLFHDRVEAYTAGAAAGKGLLLLMEEAQSVLGGADLDDQDIYVRWVKEGRKYGLGAMMVTQQPGAISPNLVSQGDNFFAMHLLAERDLRVLGQSNAHFTPEILGFLRDEPSSPRSRARGSSGSRTRACRCGRRARQGRRRGPGR